MVTKCEVGDEYKGNGRDIFCIIYRHFYSATEVSNGNSAGTGCVKLNMVLPKI
jgi:hypothetical protein